MKTKKQDAKQTRNVNSQIVLLQGIQDTNNSIYCSDDWYPINFQWIPVIKLSKYMST